MTFLSTHLFRGHLWWAVTVMLVSLSGCTQSSAPVEQEFTGVQYKSNVSSVYQVDPPTQDTKRAVSFKWLDSTGAVHSLKDLRGKVVLLNFWTTWCTNCELDLRTLESVQQEMPDSVAVLAVSTDFSDHAFKTVADFVEPMHLPYQVVVDSSMSVLIDYIATAEGRYSLPQTFLIDRNGDIQVLFQGVQPKSTLEIYARKKY